jgi:cathepsin B
MKLLGGLAVLIAIYGASAAFLDFHPLSDENIALINKHAKTWKAGKNFDIDEWDKVKKMASGLLPRSSRPKKLYKSNPHNELKAVPETFDARETWPNCDAIKQIRDQSDCGSCWAVAAVEAMSDRICIHSNQTKQIYVSAEDLTACCDSCGYGCSGGYIPETFEYWQETGIVTGGLYQSNQGCQDYSLEPCEHHVDSGTRPQCSSLNLDTPECTRVCYDTSLDYAKSKTFGQDVNTFYNEKQIQLEISTNGPVEAGFTVYDDFPTYKSGVYQTTSRTVLGGHAVKILGWGVEDGTKYWLIANSWNYDWGDAGYFKILRGSNHCGIEDDVAASLPVL